MNPTQVNAFLKANCRDWRNSQIGRGLSFVRVSLKHDPEKFPSGIPDARFVVRGRNDLYDPRIGRTRYSENTALHLLWYLRERCKVPDDEIIFETFASAANVCDEAVVNADGRLGTRYRTGCVIGADEQRTQVIQKPARGNQPAARRAFSHLQCHRCPAAPDRSLCRHGARGIA